MKALKALVSAAAAIILSAAIATTASAHHINSSHKKTFSSDRQVKDIYTARRMNHHNKCDDTADWHCVPDENGNICNFEGAKCNNTYRGLEYIENISSYTVDDVDENGETIQVEYSINRYGLYCTSCETHSDCKVLIDEVTLVVRKDDEEALVAGELGEYSNYSPEEIDSYRPHEGHIGDCQCENYDICELQIPISVKYSSHKYKGGKTCSISTSTKCHEMFCTDCGGYLGSYEKECEVSHSKCGKHSIDCVNH